MKIKFYAFLSLALILGSCSSNNCSENAEVDEFVTPDLKTFGLKGHIKSVKETPDTDFDEVKVIEFSKDGVATVKYYCGTDCKVARDEKGRISTIGSIIDDSQEGKYYVFLYVDDGKVISETAIIPNYYMTIPKEYKSFNEFGWPTSMHTETGEGGYCMSQDMVYSYPEVDDNGNWIIKEGKGTFSESEDMGDDLDHTTVSDTSDKYTREIIYYTPEELKKRD